MNTITSLHFHFQTQNEDFARQLYARWDNFFASYVERVADEVLSKYDKADEQIEIDKLELDLGDILEEELNELFPLRLREKLEEALIQCLHNITNQQNIKRISQKENTFQILCSFLLQGTLSSSASGKYGDIHKLFLKVLQENAKELKTFLQRYGHYTSLQQRLVYQLNDPELEKGVHLLSPETGSFIISYVRLLQTKYKEIEQPEITGSKYHNTVWLVVYTYLLTHRSSYFDKKSFITQTILQLAAKNNLSYDALLNLLTSELKNFRRKLSIPLELLQILESLQKELSEKRLKESLVDAAKFYKTLYSSFKKEWKQSSISDSSREGLAHILANSYSCRQFLQQLSETEIMHLLPVVAPQESRFVIEVAQSLDKQKEQGVLQGKAGGEFRLLKWQIIFPLLLDKRGTSFNRKQFVHAVLQHVADHYNLDIHSLLEYFTQDAKSLLWIDKELKNILAELLDELAPVSLSDVKEKPTVWEDLLYLLVQEPTTFEALNWQQIGHIRQKLSDNSFRQKIINQTREWERYRLIQFIYPKEQEFIISYARSLDELQRHSSLETRGRGRFADVKWMFLFTVISEMPDDSLNRRYFVKQVLQRTAAHYNLGYFDLLLYFRQQELSVHLPFGLNQLLNKLYDEEKDQWLNLILKSGREADKHVYLASFSKADSTFISSYLKTLDHYYDKGILQGKVSSNFKELKWHFVFTILLESQNSVFNKKQYISHTLSRMAAHYNLSFHQLLDWFTGGFDKSINSQFKEISNIIQELHKEHQQSNTLKEDKSTNALDVIRESWIRNLNISTSEEKKLLAQLSQQPDFIVYIRYCLEALSELRKYIRKEFNRIVNNEQLLELLIRISTNYKSLSQVEIIFRILEDWKKSLKLSIAQQNKWMQKLENVAKSNRLLNEYILYTQQVEEQKQIEKEQDTIREKENTESNPIYIDNAGMVLLTPYYPRLFKMLNLIEGEKFKDHDSQIRAMYMLQYLVFEQTDFPEYKMILNKLLVGCKTQTPIPRNIEPSEEEVATIKSLMEAALQHWGKLKNTSVASLQEAFLQRSGKLEEKEDSYLVTIEEKAYDMLIDSVSWNFRMIKYPWMEKRIEVRWR